ncbi:MAG: dihydropteroate synthase [Chloroflexi bacterium]|nr:dihydropteroate synthase [Chloroflexota bacterium]
MAKEKSPPVTACGKTELRWGERTYVMGICNLSPDSFSGDGLGSNLEAALAQARRFVAEGADIIDVGGESTRPGTKPVAGIGQELDLVIPVIQKLAAAIPVPVSVDTYKAEVARRALEAGACMINDIWGFKRDPAMAGVAAAAGVPVVLMSNQRARPAEGDIMADIIADLQGSIGLARQAGVRWENIIIDPGVGFGKKLEQNLEIVGRLAELKALGRPILLGTSRKSMIGLVLDLPVEDRLEGTAATVAIGIANGADIIRVHDVREMARVCRMSDAIVRRRQLA